MSKKPSIYINPSAYQVDIFSDVVARILNINGVGGWKDEDCRIIAKYMPTHYLELDILNSNWIPGWIKACEQEFVERCLLGTHPLELPDDRLKENL